jgi:hypothetical protein
MSCVWRTCNPLYTGSTCNLATERCWPSSCCLAGRLSPGSSHSAQQMHVSLAVLAVLRTTIEYTLKTVQESGRAEAEGRLGDSGRDHRSSGAHLTSTVQGLGRHFQGMKGREEEWQMIVYLLYPKRLSLCPASLFILQYMVRWFTLTPQRTGIEETNLEIWLAAGVLYSGSRVRIDAPLLALG